MYELSFLRPLSACHALIITYRVGSISSLLRPRRHSWEPRTKAYTYYMVSYWSSVSVIMSFWGNAMRIGTVGANNLYTMAHMAVRILEVDERTPLAAL